MSKLSDMIVYLRKRAGLSQQELADALGISRSTIGMYETGKREPDFETLEAIADFFNVDMNFLRGQTADILPYKRGRIIPIVGVIPAGSPILAIENIEGYDLADVPEDREYFFLRVKGDSMVNANIFEGDLVLVEKCPCAENGQIVACIINGEEATLKRFYRQKDTVILQPENPAYPPIIVSCKDFDAGYARILGVVRELKRKL